MLVTIENVFFYLIFTLTHLVFGFLIFVYIYVYIFDSPSKDDNGNMSSTSTTGFLKIDTLHSLENYIR